MRRHRETPQRHGTKRCRAFVTGFDEKWLKHVNQAVAMCQSCSHQDYCRVFCTCSVISLCRCHVRSCCWLAMSDLRCRHVIHSHPELRPLTSFFQSYQSQCFPLDHNFCTTITIPRLPRFTSIFLSLQSVAFWQRIAAASRFSIPGCRASRYSRPDTADCRSTMLLVSTLSESIHTGSDSVMTYLKTRDETCAE